MFCTCYAVVFFFFKQKTAYEMRISDWSSDVCSSDLVLDRLDCIVLLPAIVDQRLEQHFGGLPGARLVDDPFDGLLRDASAHVASMRALDCSFFMTARLHFQHTEPRYFPRSEEHTSELQVPNAHLVCRLLLENKKKTTQYRKT